MSVSSNQINYLIWRYLQESGHPLSALAIDKETDAGSLDQEYEKTAPGELVRLVLKGLQMETVEKQIISTQPQNDLEPVKTLVPGITCVSRHGAVAVGTLEGTLLDSTIKLDSNSPVTCLAFSTGDQLAQGSYSGQLRVWDRQGTLLRALNRHTHPLMVLKWNRTGTHLFSADTKGNICVWEGSSLISESQVADFLCASWIDARTLAVSTGRDIQVYKLDLSHPRTQFHGHMAPTCCLAFDQATQLLASGADDGLVNAWHGRSQQPVRSLQGSSPVLDLQWIPSAFTSLESTNTKITSKLLVAYSKQVALWDVDSSMQLWSIPLAASFVFMACYHGELIAISADKLYVYRLETTEPLLIGEFTPAKPITGICWNKKILVATSTAGTYQFDFSERAAS